MPQGAPGAPAWFVSVSNLATASLENVRMYLVAIGLDDYAIHHTATLGTFSTRMRLYILKLSPDKSRIRAARADFLGHVISADGVLPDGNKVAALTRMPILADIKHLCSLLSSLSYYSKLLFSMAHHICPITAILKKALRLI